MLTAEHQFFGTAGWNIPGQHAHYSPGEGTHLQRYSRILNCAEINSCFYREHKPETYAKWAAAVPQNFRFAVKAPRTVTHEGLLSAASQSLLKRFLDQTESLGEKRGPVLLQIPPSLQFEPLEAAKFFAVFRKLYRGLAAFEPRHASWFSGDAEALLREFEIARVAADPAVVPEAAQPAGWPGLVYYRLHGSPRRYYSEYSNAYLESLAIDITQAHEATAVWCIFDNTASGSAIVNAVDLTRRLQPTRLSGSDDWMTR